MNILITAPSLNIKKNVSGIATVASSIITYNNSHNYFHYLLGRPDKYTFKISWLFLLIKQLISFPFALKRNRIDLVHQNFPFNNKGLLREYTINLWCRIFKVPVFLHVHGGELLMHGTTNKLYLKLTNSLFTHSRQVVVLSEIEKNALSNLYRFTNAKVLCNSIDSSSYGYKNNSRFPAKPTFLFLGRIHESKGIEDIINAFRLLRAKNLEFHFILCGSGPLMEATTHICSNLLGNDFEYLGIVSGEEKIKVIKRADFFLLPSRYGEGLPMALLETMATSVVPIVTDDASMKFVVKHLINGIRVMKNNSQDLAEKIEYIMNNPKLYKSLSESARITVARNYDISNYINELNQIYKLAI